MKPSKSFIALTLSIVITFQPLVLLAQTGTTGTGTTGGTGATTGNGSGTYNPSGTSGNSNGKSFSGTSFSGVGGAIAGCANIGGMLVGAVSGLFNKGAGSGGGGTGGGGAHTDTSEGGGAHTDGGGSGPAGGTGGGGAHTDTTSGGGAHDGGATTGDGKGTTKTTDSTSTGTGQSVPTADSGVKAETSATKEEGKKANRVAKCLNGIAFAAAKSLLQQVSNKTLNWINTGLGGNPLYVQDINSSLRTIRDEKLQSYFQGVQNSNPIFGNALRSVVTRETTGLTDGYLNKAMNTPEAKQYNAFQKNFTNGSWGSLLNMNNNPIGALYNSVDQLSDNIGSEKENRVNEVQRNNGFLDMRECVEYEKIKPSNTTGHNTGPTCNGGIPKDELPPDTTCVPDKVAGGDTTGGTSKKPKCLTWKTSTPGSTIANQTNNILGSPTRQLELADSINELLGAFFDQVLNNLYQKGLNSLQNGKKMKNNFGGVGANIVLGANGFPIDVNGGGNAFGYQLPGAGGNNVEEFDISRPQQLRAIVQTQYNFLNRSKDSQIALRSILPALGALDYCIPGPNPTWRNGLNNNFQSFITSFETPTQGRTFGNKLLGALGKIDLGGGIGAVLSIFGFNSDDKVLNYWSIGVSDQLDKVTGDTRESRVWEYKYYTKDYARGVKNTSPMWNLDWLTSGLNRVVDKYETKFTDTNIINLFVSSAGDPTYAKGAAKDAINETSKILLYSENFKPLNDDYSEVIGQKQDALVELEDIRKEALKIVKVAKARHIAEQAAAGTPVNMSCIDRAYVIDESPIVPVTRNESDTPDPMIRKSAEARAYFYSKL